MELKGNLKNIPLHDVLLFIQEKEHTGYLDLRLNFPDNRYASLLVGDDLHERLIVRNGNLQGLQSLQDPDTWCRFMVRLGLIPRSEEKALHDRLSGLGDIFLQALAGVLESDGLTVRDRIQFLLGERAGWLFCADDGDFEFLFDDPPPPPPGWEPVAMDELAERGTECANVMNAFFAACPDPDTTLSVVPIGDDDPVPPSLSTEEWDLLRRVNGRKTILHFLRESRLPLHMAAYHLLALMKEGYIEASARGEGDEAGEEDRVCNGKRPSGLRRMFRGSRSEEEAPRDSVGRMCLLANRFITQAGDAGADFRRIWKEIRRTRPLASVLEVGEDGFHPGQFAADLEAWGGHAEDWQDVEVETREALEALVSRLYRDLFLKEGKKRADAALRRVLQEVPEEDGIPSFNTLQESLPAA
jgi:hypothetical protein